MKTVFAYVYYMCCVSITEAIKTRYNINELKINNKTNCIAFQFLYMTLAIGIMKGHSLIVLTKHIMSVY